MKHFLQFSLMAIFLIFSKSSQEQQVAKVKNKQDVVKVKGLNIKGAYAMYNQVVNDGSKDSVMGNEQLKIYTDHYMMYAHKNPMDSFATYGIGKYETTNGKVIEYVFYTSGDGARNDTFQLDVNLAKDGYTQVINFPADSGRSFRLTEDYKTVSKNITSPLDGAWKQTKVINVDPNGKTWTNNNPTQFKVFQSGHFMWASTIQDSATKKPMSFFGYGTFEMSGDKVTEVNTNSTFATNLVGTPVDLKIKFTGKDAYEQTINWPDGSKSMEFYERLK